MRFSDNGKNKNQFLFLTVKSILLWDLSRLFYYKNPQNFYITYSEFNPNSTEANKIHSSKSLWDHTSLNAFRIRKAAKHNHGAQNRTTL